MSTIAPEANGTAVKPPPLPKAQVDLADRKRLFPGHAPETVSDELLERARREESRKPAEQLPIAKQHVHSGYWLRQAEKSGISREEAEEMTPPELQEAIKHELLMNQTPAARQENNRQRELAPSPSAPPPAAAVPVPAAAAAVGEDDLLSGIDLDEVDDNIAAVLKRLAGTVTGLAKANKEKEAVIGELKTATVEQAAADSTKWFLGECVRFNALRNADGTPNIERCQEMNDMILVLQQRGRHGKNVREDLTKLTKRLYNDDSLYGQTQEPNPTNLARPTHRIGADELTGKEAAEQAAREYLDEVAAATTTEPAKTKPLKL